MRWTILRPLGRSLLSLKSWSGRVSNDMLTTRQIVDDALKFWERGRLIYNGVLIIPIAIMAFLAIHWSLRGILVVTYYVIVTNLLYCTAYPIDLLFQHSSWRSIWLRFRWALWLLGTALALLFGLVLTLAVMFS